MKGLKRTYWEEPWIENLAALCGVSLRGAVFSKVRAKRHGVHWLIETRDGKVFGYLDIHPLEDSFHPSSCPRCGRKL